MGDAVVDKNLRPKMCKKPIRKICEFRRKYGFFSNERNLAGEIPYNASLIVIIKLRFKKV